MRAQIVLFEGFAPLDVFAPYAVLLWAGGLASERTAGRLRLGQAEEGLEGPRGRGTMTNADHATVLVDDSECDPHGITR